MKIFRIYALFLALFLHAQPIIVGTNATYPPFEFINAQNNLVGFDIDLAKALGKHADFVPKFVNISFDALIPALKTGKIMIAISAMSKTPERLREVNFSDTYFVSKNAFLAKKSSKFATKNDLAGKKIGYLLGSTQEATAKSASAKTVALEDMSAAFLSLQFGKIDALVLDDAVAILSLKNAKSAENFVIFHREVDQESAFALAFHKNSDKTLLTKINLALQKMRENGELSALLKKWEL